MKRYVAMVVLLVAAGGFVAELSKHQSRERDLRNFTPEEQAEFDRLSKLIHHPSPEKRRDAAEGFEEFRSIEAIPLLVGALCDSNNGVKIAAIKALEQIDYRIGQAGCRNLLFLARDRDAQVRAGAERALPKLCEWRATPLILAEAQRADCENKSFLFALLEHCTGHTIPPKQEDEAIACEATAESQQADEEFLIAAWLDWYKKYEDKMPVDWLIDDLKSPRAASRARAAELLGKIGDKKAVSHLINILDEEDEDVLRKALHALVELQASEAVPRILVIYPNTKGGLAQECEKTLRILVSLEHIDALLAGMAQADVEKHDAYSRFLEIASGHRMPEGEDALPYWTAYAARMKGLSPLRIYALEMKDKDPRNRFEAARRLKRFGEDAVEYFLEALDDESHAVREQVVKSLRTVTFHYEGYQPGGPLGARSEAAKGWRSWWESKKDMDSVERLTAQLNDRRDARNRAEAARGLKETDAWEGVPYLIGALSEDGEGLRNYAARALRGITKRSFGFVSNAPMKERNDAITRWRSWWIRTREMDKEKMLVATIRDIAVDKAAKIRAIRALAEMRSEKAATALTNLLDDKSFVTASAAQEALEKITSKSFFYLPTEKDVGCVPSKAFWMQYIKTLRKG